MTQPPPDLRQLTLPHLWREFNPSLNPQTFRHLQKLPTGSDPAINVVLDSANHYRVGWIHPWTQRWLMRHDVRVLDLAFNMETLYEIWPELLAHPERLNAWLDGWSRREQERQGLPPLPAN